MAIPTIGGGLPPQAPTPLSPPPQNNPPSNEEKAQPKKPLIHLKKDQDEKEKQGLLKAIGEIQGVMNEFKEAVEADKPITKTYAFLMVSREGTQISWQTAGNTSHYALVGMVQQYLINSLKATIRK